MCFGRQRFVTRISKLRQEGRCRFSWYGFIRNLLTQLKASAILLYCVIACAGFLQPTVWCCQTVKVLRHLNVSSKKNWSVVLVINSRKLCHMEPIQPKCWPKQQIILLIVTEEVCCMISLSYIFPGRECLCSVTWNNCECHLKCSISYSTSSGNTGKHSIYCCSHQYDI